MTTTPVPTTPPPTTTRKPLRLWPGVTLAVLLFIGRFIVPVVNTEWAIYGVLGGLALSLAILLWWLLFSRAPWAERLGILGLIVVALYLTRLVIHESIRTGGMGMGFFILALPVLMLALAASAAAARHLADAPRRAVMAGAIVLACAGFTLLRTGGIDGDFDNEFAWRWSETPEDRLVAQEPVAPAVVPSAAPTAAPSVPAPAASGAPVPAAAVAPPPGAIPLATTPPEWPGFRGPERDGVVRGARIATDWTASPPVELWRRPVGPGWSSFAVHGDVVYTQEQRGENEVVAAYDRKTGKPVWMHATKARFWESNAGAGPRGTPTLAGGRVYALGGTGMVSAVDARTGAPLWTHDAAADTKTATPTWGFSSSPLVIDGQVIVAASGTLIAYDAATGERRWLGPPAGGASYSSPQLVTLAGVPQVLLVSAKGLSSVSPSDGKMLWHHPWEGYPIVQPALTDDGDVLISVGQDSGTRRLSVTHGPSAWTTEERWTSNGLKAYFNDFVVHEGYAYGIDGRLVACIDLADGQRKWKGGRYGAGQVILLPEQDLLLVLGEQGELALVKAAPDGFTEVATAHALEGKTWNHPVLVGDTLLVRNDREMAAFRLARAER
jgi:outer membrane protein assembly factor BamB